MSRLAQAQFLPWPLRRAAIARRMRIDSPVTLEARLEAINYVRQSRNASTVTGNTGPVWQFWDQAEDLAPPVVRNCLRSVERNLDGRARILLNARTVANHVDFSGAVMDRLDFWGWTKFSNLLRLKLLENHGGTWVDATVFFARAIPDQIAERDFFAFQWDHDPRIVATWFMHSRAHYPLITAISAAYEEYWLNAKVPGDYFMFHHIFEALVISDARLAALWRRMPKMPAAVPHELQWMLHLPFDETAFRSTLDRSWIQKLTYKLDETVAGDPASFLGYLSRPALTGLQG